MSVTREERQKVDHNWQSLEKGMARAVKQVIVNPHVVVRIDVRDEKSAESIWELLTDDEKKLVAISWTTAHFMSRHPDWIRMADAGEIKVKVESVKSMVEPSKEMEAKSIDAWKIWKKVQDSL